MNPQQQSMTKSVWSVHSRSRTYAWVVPAVLLMQAAAILLLLLRANPQARAASTQLPAFAMNSSSPLHVMRSGNASGSDAEARGEQGQNQEAYQDSGNRVADPDRP